MKKAIVVLVEWREQKRAENYSLGLNYIHAAIVASGNISHTLITNEKDIEKICESISSIKPDIVGLKLYDETAEVVFKISSYLKDLLPQSLIVVGGHTATLNASLILNQEKSIDLVSNGEGEETFVELCEIVKNAGDLSKCKGITYRHIDGEIYANAKRDNIENLDQLTLPDSKIFLDTNSKFLVYAISTSRGCIGNCYFCVVNHVYELNGKKQWRGMSPKKIIREINNICRENPDKKLFIKFLDSSIENPNPKTKERIIEIIDGIEQMDYKIKFSFFSRAESWSEKDANLILRMKNAGLYKIYLGFDESIKRYSIRETTEKMICEENVKANNLFKSNNIKITGYLIIFQPFITLKQLVAVAQFIDKIDMSYSPDVWTQEVILFSDTSLFHDVVAAGLLLGTTDNGYSYAYAFEDGRVGALKNKICEIKTLASYQAIRNTILKIELELEELELSEIDDEIQVIINEYKTKIGYEYSYLGEKQKELFISAIDNASRDSSLHIYKDIIRRWGRLMAEAQKRLEIIWLRNRVFLLRKGVIKNGEGE